jgi:peptidoglycan/xylan/chitin deacetylase (PgdA/CDA1 family)/GT2 family glycosyltransferase
MISIVIPALNEEKLLPSCLRSLQKQEYQDPYEIIVVDNGSTDNTANIARDFEARVIPANDIESVYYARQVGADAAAGDIIVQADADTVYPSDWLNRIAGQFSTNPEVVALTGRYFYRDRFIWSKLEYLARHVVNKANAVLFGAPLWVSGATFAFRRSAFLSLNGYRGLTYSADQRGICERLRKAGRVLYDPDLHCFTSSRSVQKPTLTIIRNIFVNAFHWHEYDVKNYLSSLLRFINKSPVRRMTFRLLPIPILVISVGCYGYFIPASPVFGKVYYKGSPVGNTVALTFDDGPNEPYTSQVLDILNRYNIKATFFIIGKNAELYPDSARQILTEGHVIGNHSYSHNANHALTEYGARDLILGEEAIYNITRVIPHLYRPPHGKKSPWELQAVKKNGMIEVTWSVAANDQHALAFLGGEPSPEKFAQEIVHETHPGEIILLHDGYGTLHNVPKADKNLTVEALPLIIEQLQAKGYRFVTVPELLDKPAYNEGIP